VVLLKGTLVKKLPAFLSILVLAAPVWAANQTVTLSVPGMDCATCPITVKKALTKISGVLAVSSNLDKRETTVTFDDAKTTLVALTHATREAGYPSSVAGRPAK
jgi:periplasmic mercuric ion binding protein